MQLGRVRGTVAPLAPLLTLRSSARGQTRTDSAENQQGKSHLLPPAGERVVPTPSTVMSKSAEPSDRGKTPHSIRHTAYTGLCCAEQTHGTPVHLPLVHVPQLAVAVACVKEQPMGTVGCPRGRAQRTRSREFAPELRQPRVPAPSAEHY